MENGLIVQPSHGSCIPVSETAPATADLGMGTTMDYTFLVQTLTCAKQVHVLGFTVGDLKTAIKRQFGIPVFEQSIVYNTKVGPVALNCDDSVLLHQRFLGEELALTRRVDPRSKEAKESAFLQALVACRFNEAKEIIGAELKGGASINPDCIHSGRSEIWPRAVECPTSYRHPALIVAVMAGFENAFKTDNDVDGLHVFMSHEAEICELVELLIQRGANVNAMGNETLTHQTPLKGSKSFVTRNKTPLCAAVQRGSPHLVRMLLDAKANPNHTAETDSTSGLKWQLKPESFGQVISNGSLAPRDVEDPRNQYAEEILEMLVMRRCCMAVEQSPKLR